MTILRNKKLALRTNTNTTTFQGAEFISPHSQTSDSMWFIRTEDVEANKWLLHDPCSWKYDYFDPPPGDYRFSFNLLDEHCIMNVATLFTLHHVSDLENCPLGKHGFSFTRLMPCVRKLVHFPDWTRFLLLCGTKGSLVLWSESNQWTFLNTGGGGGGCQFDDIVYHQGITYALDTSGSLFSIHPTRLHLTKIASSPLKLDGDVHVMHLVSSEECLYLVYSAHMIHDKRAVMGGIQSVSGKEVQDTKRAKRCWSFCSE